MTIDEWTLTPRSSHVAGLAWEEVGRIDAEAKNAFWARYGTLYVAFKNGKVYSYEGVSQHDFELIKDAQSVGGALHRLGITNPLGRRQVLVGRFDPDTGVALPSR